MTGPWTNGKPPFLNALEEDARNIFSVYRVDQQETLGVALLMLTHFLANVPRDGRGRVVRSARDFIIATAVPRMPAWLGHYTRFLAGAKDESSTARTLVQVHHTATEFRQLADDKRHLEQFGNMFANDIEMIRYQLSRIRMAAPTRFMLDHPDGGLMPRQGMRASVTLVLDGPSHLAMLRAACRKQTTGRSILGAFCKTETRMSVMGWCDWATLAAAMRGQAAALSRQPPVPGLPGRPLLLPEPPPRHQPSMAPPYSITAGFEKAFRELVQTRFLREQFRFVPDPDTCGKLKVALAAEKAAVAGFPATIRQWAEPVVGLSLAITVLFYLLGSQRDSPAETEALTDLAMDAASRIRERALGWLRHALAAESMPVILPVDRAVYEKLLLRGSSSTRDLCRAFHKMRGTQLDEALTRLQAAGLVENDDGLLAVVPASRQAAP